MKKFLYFMVFFLLILDCTLWASTVVFDVEADLNFGKSWYQKEKSDEENIKRLADGLAKIPSGKLVLQKAKEKAKENGQTLYDVVGIGDGSLTDTTLIRRFSAANPAHVMYETKSKVFLNRHLKTLDALLDFAHELTHYTYREAFNPYDFHFHLKDFIKSTIEGKGGEVDAYIVECQVLKELLPGEGFFKSHCPKIYDEKIGALSKELGIEEFYKVGSHFEILKKDLEKFSVNEGDLPKSSGKEAIFISSAWGLPYPVAAVKEYANIMERVCKNDQKRISLMEAKIKRAPADENSSIDKLNHQEMFEDFQKRCIQFEAN